jgi:hypothetical protein
MPNRLNIPQDLNSLIEKREGDDRRHGNEGEAAPADDIAESENKPCAEKTKRSGEDRRNHTA